MDTSPPVGSAPPGPPGPPCAPCAGPPSDCIPDLIALTKQVCALQTNYLDVIQKYGALLSKVQAGTLSINDIAGEIDGLQEQINLLETNSCSGLGNAVAVDALIACLAGQEKVVTPGSAGQSIISFLNAQSALQWQVGNAGPDYLKVGPAQLFSGSSTNAGQNFDVTLPQFPTFSRFCLAMLQVQTVNQNSGASSTNVALNGVVIGHCGPQSQEVFSFPLMDVTEAAQTFEVSATGDARTWTVTVNLLGYFFR